MRSISVYGKEVINVFTCETLIVMSIVLVVFVAGIGAVLGSVDLVMIYDQREDEIYERKDVINGEVMRVAQVLFDYIE